MEPITERKDRLRKQFRKIRTNISPEVRNAQSHDVCARLFTHLQAIPVQTIHIYWPLVSRGELDTRPLIDKLEQYDYRIVLPRIIREDDQPSAQPLMSHHIFTGADSLSDNQWGIAEPTNASSVQPNEIDAVVVPALGAGRNRHRIGHGRGYYDKFLSDLSALTICAIFDECLIDVVPTEPHDIPLDVILTRTEKISGVT